MENQLKIEWRGKIIHLSALIVRQHALFSAVRRTINITLTTFSDSNFIFHKIREILDAQLNYSINRNIHPVVSNFYFVSCFLYPTNDRFCCTYNKKYLKLFPFVRCFPVSTINISSINSCQYVKIHIEFTLYLSVIY